MSSMLEQAIVDATALREAALKNAEAAIIEKYAPEIKSAVDTLLEQPELDDELAGELEMPAADTPEAEEVDAPPAYAEEEKACPCPDDKEEVELELSIDALSEMAKELEPDSTDLEEREEHEELAEDLPLQESDNSDNDEIVFDEADIAALVEELVVDIAHPQKSGWAGMPESEIRFAEELELARLAGDEAREKQEALEKAVKSLEESNTNLKKSNKTLKETVLKMKSAFDDMSTSNAKLLYTNRILSSPSLNERQKESIVEAINKAGSVDEAKVIYETLQSTGGTSRRRQMPKSLSEAITRSSSTVLPRRQSDKRTTDTAIDRLQILAGIKHNK